MKREVAFLESCLSPTAEVGRRSYHEVQQRLRNKLVAAKSTWETERWCSGSRQKSASDLRHGPDADSGETQQMQPDCCKDPSSDGHGSSGSEARSKNK